MSSFGLSGTNAHLILEEAPAAAPAARRPAEVPASTPLVLSARNPASLRQQAKALLEHLTAHPEQRLADLGFSLATSRAALDRRAVVLAASQVTARHALTALSEGTESPDVVTGTAASDGLTAFLFTGQGAQRAGMGAALYGVHPVFARALDAVCGVLDPLLPGSVPGSLRAVMFAEPGSAGGAALDRTEFTQCALFAFEVALFRLVESWGVVPDVLLGHSVGEIVAAHVAGVLSLGDACVLVAARGRLMQALPSGGAMVAVQATEEEVLPLLTGRVSIAAVNGPRAVVLSGAADDARPRSRRSCRAPGGRSAGCRCRTRSTRR